MLSLDRRAGARPILAIALAALVLGAGCGGGSSPSGAPTTAPTVNIVAVNDLGQLVNFSSATPSTFTSVATITGLQGGESAIACDFRPANATMYVFTNQDRLYSVNITTTAATLVGSVTVTGNVVTIDFNPAVDRLRVITDANENLRVNPDNAAVTTDTPLAYATGDVNFGVTPMIQAIAYSGKQAPGVASPTATTLVGFDVGRDAEVLIGGVAGSPSPNTGQLFTRQNLGFTGSFYGGAEIEGAFAYISVTQPGVAGGAPVLHAVNLNTGEILVLGRIGPAAPVPILGLTIRR